jgi:NADPH-dependent curcumin reductase CurA
MAIYNTVVLAKRPTGDIKAGETFKLKPEKRIEKSDLKDRQVLVESRYLSLDPAMRGWLNGKNPAPTGYF